MMENVMHWPLQTCTYGCYFFVDNFILTLESKVGL
jgi:hypothetical protein